MNNISLYLYSRFGQMDDPNYEDDIYSYPTLMRVKKRVQFPPLPAGYLRLPKPVMRYFSPMLRG